jgi:hypothetical protein
MNSLEDNSELIIFIIAKKYKTRMDLYVAPMELLVTNKTNLAVTQKGDYQFHTIATEDGVRLLEAPEVYLQKIHEFSHGDAVIQHPFDVRTFLNLDIPLDSEVQAIDELSHNDIQAKLLIIGNFLGYKTYTPDRSKNSCHGILGELSTEENLSSDYIAPRQLNTIKNIDVIWLDDHCFPTHCFEVEHTTDITKGLLRLYQVRKLHAKLFIVASDEMRKKFETETNKDPFFDIKDKYLFRTYVELNKFLLSAKEFTEQRTTFLNEKTSYTLTDYNF